MVFLKKHLNNDVHVRYGKINIKYEFIWELPPFYHQALQIYYGISNTS